MAEPERRAAPPPPTETPSVEGTAAAAGLLAIGATGVDISAGLGAATTARVSADAAGTIATAAVIAALLFAFRRFFQRKRLTDEAYLRDTLTREYVEPGSIYKPSSDAIIRRAISDELDFERQFERRQLARVERDLNAAAAVEEYRERMRRIQVILDREKRFIQMREQMMLTRSRSAIERATLKESSPLGAYWKLSPYVREHTLDCIHMGGRFWPWSVLDLIHPPMHPGCPCMLYGRDEAIEAGWIRADDPIPDTATALHDAQRAIDIAHERERRMRERRLQETADEGSELAPHALRAWVEDLGYDAYEVGGAVRDSLRGVEPKDIDFMVVATPAQIREAVKREGGRSDDLIVRDRVVGVRAYLPGVTPPGGVEIAPPRVEVSTGDGRHDFAIEPHPGLKFAEGYYTGEEMMEPDALRRDFTVNALYRDFNGNVYDPTGQGLDDLQAGVLRTTHPSSFRDDPLRIMRAARFVARGFELEESTRAQMVEHADAVDALTRRGVSGTVRDELNKILMADRPGAGLRLLRDTGALAHVLPEWAPLIGYDQESRYHALPGCEHSIRVVEGVAAAGGTLEARLGALWHDVGKTIVAVRGKDGRLHFYAHPDNGNVDHADASAEVAEAGMTRLGYSRAVIEHVATVAREHMVKAADRPTPVRARRMRARLSDEVIADTLAVRRADMRSKGEDDDPIPTPGLDELERMIAEAEEEDAPRAVGDLVIDGTDLLAVGYRPGPAIGVALRGLLAEAIDQPKLNDRDWLLKHAEKRRRKLEEAAGMPTIEPERADAIGRVWVERHTLLGDDYDAADYERAVRRQA